jgi:hypothetical protein
MHLYHDDRELAVKDQYDRQASQVAQRHILQVVEFHY